MNKFTKILISLVLIMSACFCFTACDEVENGSKIQRMKIELEYLDASGAVVDTQTAELKLYLNFAPETTKHFMNLAKSGYYDGVTISNVNDSWCEFGAYTRSGNQLTAKKYDGGTVKGEFKKNGFGGTKLIPSSGALIMKRNYDVTNGTDNSQKYDSATNSVIVTFRATAKFSQDDYCYFGMLVADDGDAYDDTVSTADLDRSKLSSVGKFNSIERLEQNEKGNKTYYFEKASDVKEGDKYYAIKSDYYSVIYDDDDVAHYYKGTSAVAENELVDDEKDLYVELSNEYNSYMLVIPVTEVRIKSIK